MNLFFGLIERRVVNHSSCSMSESRELAASFFAPIFTINMIKEKIRATGMKLYDLSKIDENEITTVRIIKAAIMWENSFCSIENKKEDSINKFLYRSESDVSAKHKV